jgi:tetratricopeptide (TPR) repeat protein
MDISKALPHIRFLISKGRYNESIRESDRLLRVSPNLFDAWLLRGMAFQNSRQFEQALESYNCAKKIKRDSDSFHLWYNIGVVLCVLKRYEDAHEALQKAVQTNPGISDAWNHLGIVLYELGEFEKAIEAYKSGISISPDDDVLWANLGNSYRKLIRNEQALESYNKALELNPKSISALIGKGNYFLDREDLPHAIDFLSKAAEFEPNSYTALNSLGVALFKNGNIGKALESVEMALKIKPDYADALSNKSTFKYKLGDIKGSLELIDRAIEIDPANSKLWVNKSSFLSDSNRLKEAILACDQAIKNDARLPEAWFNKGYFTAQLEREQPLADKDPQSEQYIFISLGRGNRQEADKIREYVENQGIRCWLYWRDLKPILSWSGQLSDAIKNSSLFLILISKGSSESENVLREVNIAARYKIPIFPVELERDCLSNDLEFFCRSVQMYDASTGDFDSHLESIAPAIRNLLKQ